MSSIIRSEIDSIRAGIYGEDIRGDICTAFEKLSDTESTGTFPFKTAIENAINSAIDTAIDGLDIGEDALKFKGILYNNVNLNTYATARNGTYSGIYFIYYDHSYTNLPSEFASLDCNGLLVNVNGSDEAIDADGSLGTPFLQIVFPIGVDFNGKFWARTSTTQGWKVAGGVVVDPNDIATAVTNYFDTHPPLSPTDQAAIEAALDSYMQTHDVSADVDAENVYPIITNYIGNPPSDALKNKIASWSKAGMGGANTGGIYDAVAQFNSVYAAWNEDPNNADNQAPEPYIWHVDSDGSGPDKAYYDQTVYDALFEYRAGGSYPKNVMNELTRYVVSDGILGFAAFKRTNFWKTPQMYGAKADGLSDDKDAIQRAIDANKGGTLYFPAGTYMISDTIQVGYAPIGQNAYTNLVLDPCAIIKAKSGFHGATNTTGSAAGMIAIGQHQWHAWNSTNDGGLLINKSKKKFLIGGVFDSNSQRVSTVIRVSQDVYNFDMSYTEIIATDSATGLAIGSSGWSRKNFGTSETPDWRYAAYDASKIAKGVEFVLSSMDAYVHHVNIRKHSYDVANRENFYTQAQYDSYVAKNYYHRVADDPGNDSSYNKHNRASGIVVYSNDNNFENIRVCYFKRNVKITHGTGNYFSEVHTLGLKAGYYVNSSGNTLNPRNETTYPDVPTWEAANPIFVEKPLVKSTNTDAANKTIVDNYYSTYYPKDSSGFHLEKETEITLDKCYVDSDDFFVYVTPEAAGSKINVSQCMFFQYSEVEKNMVGFFLGNSYYTADTIEMTPANASEWTSGTGVNQYNSSTGKVTINNPYKGKLTALFADGFQFSPSGSKVTNQRRHYGIKISSNNFFDQTHSSTMSLERINTVGHNRFVYGDLLAGASSGSKGSILLRPTTLERNGSTANSKWYALCSIPVGNGSNSAIQYRITLDTGGMFTTFSLYLYRYANPSSNVHLNASLGASTPVLVSDDDREYEIGFTYASNRNDNGSSAPCAYVMWIRMINGLSAGGSYYTRSIRGAKFESTHAITPAPYQGGLAVLTSTSSNPSFVKINTTSNNVIRMSCKTPSIGLASI